MILTSIQCVFIDFRFHRYVTSGDVIYPPFPCEGSGNTLGELPPFEVLFNTLFFRIYGYPCEGTGAQFEVHARTN